MNLPTGPWEVKSTRGKDIFYTREIKPHQKHALIACTTEEGFTFKIPDAGYAFLPFDGVTFKNSPAFIIVAFPVFFYVFDVNSFPFSEVKIREQDADFYCMKKAAISDLNS